MSTTNTNPTISLALRKLQVSLYTDLNTDALRQLLNLPAVYREYAEKIIEKQAEEINNDNSLSEDEKHMLSEYLADDSYDIDVLLKFYDDIPIITLYKTIEINIKNATKASGIFDQEDSKATKNSEKPTERLYKLKDFKKNFKNKGIDITSILNYSSYLELRELNNCLKHSGKVSNNLHQITTRYGKVNENITSPNINFHDLLDNNMIFLCNFGAELRARI
ncbi:hypothetical protein KC986_12515 [Proteus mirabilis]|uniref:hypothetical protein n=1 Tax=Proteus mirabilis TaxID=584 RepID=UPI00235E084B|nr:hypothetical protein [Proteus mirabilis]MDC9784025.1 hypothetical protein [Proteus mirabilis]